MAGPPACQYSDVVLRVLGGHTAVVVLQVSVNEELDPALVIERLSTEIADLRAEVRCAELGECQARQSVRSPFKTATHLHESNAYCTVVHVPAST